MGLSRKKSFSPNESLPPELKLVVDRKTKRNSSSSTPRILQTSSSSSASAIQALASASPASSSSASSSALSPSTPLTESTPAAVTAPAIGLSQTTPQQQSHHELNHHHHHHNHQNHLLTANHRIANQQNNNYNYNSHNQQQHLHKNHPQQHQQLHHHHQLLHQQNHSQNLHNQHKNYHPHNSSGYMIGSSNNNSKMHPLRNPAVNLAVNNAVAATKDLMAQQTAHLHMNSGSHFAGAPASSSAATTNTAASSAALSQSSTSFRFFKYFVFSYMLLVLLIEIVWAAYSVQGLKKDLQVHVEMGQWEQTYLREFFKSTKNFFMFNLILIFLSICIGCAAVGTENRHLMLAFIFVFSIEWFFEVIGVYNSKEKNVVIYRMIPALLRPGLIVSTLIFYRTVSKMQNRLAREIEKEEANKPPTPPVALRSAAGVIRPPPATLMTGHSEVPKFTRQTQNHHHHHHHNQHQQHHNRHPSRNDISSRAPALAGYANPITVETETTNTASPNGSSSSSSSNNNNNNNNNINPTNESSTVTVGDDNDDDRAPVEVPNIQLADQINSNNSGDNSSNSLGDDDKNVLRISVE